MCNKPPYVAGTSLDEIISDGWSRDLDPQQTVDEAAIMGHTVTLDEVKAGFNEWDESFRESLQRSLP